MNSQMVAVTLVCAFLSPWAAAQAGKTGQGNARPTESGRNPAVRTQRLARSSSVLGVSNGGASKAYPLAELESNPVVNDRLGNQMVVVLYDRARQAAAAYRPSVGGKPAAFTALGSGYPGLFRDSATESTWSAEGLAVDGPEKGQRLVRLDCLQTTWSSWRAAHSGTVIDNPPHLGARNGR